MSPILGVFDFDHTIIDDNSDVVFVKLLPEEIIKSQRLRDLRPQWTSYMAEVFKLLNEFHTSKDTMLEHSQKFKATDGFIELFEYLKEKKIDVIILSDANSIVINTWIEHNLRNIPVNKIVTNPSKWNDNDVLELSPFENQLQCKKCPSNLCKGKALEDYLADSDNYDMVFYVGDGRNDLCPSSRLQRKDLVFPRKEYPLNKLILDNPIEASVHPWSTGVEIKQHLQREVEKKMSS